MSHHATSSSSYIPPPANITNFVNDNNTTIDDILDDIDDEDDRPLSGITSTTNATSYFRPSSIATTATIVHIQGQQYPTTAPSSSMLSSQNVRQNGKKNHVIFYDSLAPSYHTLIKVTKSEKYKKGEKNINGKI